MHLSVKIPNTNYPQNIVLDLIILNYIFTTVSLDEN